MAQCKRIGHSFLLTQHFRRRFATGSYYVSKDDRSKWFSLRLEFFSDEDEFDKILSSVGQEELDSVLENSGALVAAVPQPHPFVRKAAPGDLQRYKDKNGTKTLKSPLQPRSTVLTRGDNGGMFLPNWKTSLFVSPSASTLGRGGAKNTTSFKFRTSSSFVTHKLSKPYTLNGLRVLQRPVGEVLQRWKEGCPKRCLPQEMKGALWSS